MLSAASACSSHTLRDTSPGQGWNGDLPADDVIRSRWAAVKLRCRLCQKVVGGQCSGLCCNRVLDRVCDRSCRCERCPKAISVRSSIALLEVKLDCLRGMRRATVENGAACSLTSHAVLNSVAVKLQPDQEAHRKSCTSAIFHAHSRMLSSCLRADSPSHSMSSNSVKRCAAEIAHPSRRPSFVRNGPSCMGGGTGLAPTNSLA